MNAPTPLPDVDTLHKLFDYTPSTGELRWRPRVGVQRDWNERYAGKLVGTKDRLGRVRTHIDGHWFRVHRIVYKMAHGSEPDLIDHINCDPSDNRIENLRAATAQQNNQNKRRRGKFLKGVVKCGSGFGALIKHNNECIWLGRFDTENEAHFRYRAEATKLFGDFARFE